MAGISLSGLASGLDWKSLVDQLVEIERTPQTVMAKEQAGIRTQSNAYKTIKNSLNALKVKTDALAKAELFNARGAASSDSAILKSTAASGAVVGTYKFDIDRLSTAAVRQGTTDAGSKLSATDDVSSLKVSDAGFSVAVTAGTFTVNGKQVTIATDDTLQAVFDKVSTATGGVVTGSYESDTDTISFTSSGTLLLGATTDTSNFLQVAKLYNNATGTGTVTSSSELGSVRLAKPLAAANFATAVSDGGAGEGGFKINGVEIAFNATTDTVGDLLKRINNSTAGVTAAYDVVNDRFTLTNKTGGDVGISLEDVTGNFLAASGLSSGSLVRGQDMAYTVNGGPTLYSRGNVIDGASSGIEGLSVTAVKEGEATVDVSANTASVKTAINEFIAAFNSLQDTIETYTSSSTDSAGKVTTAALSDDLDAADIGSYLRRNAFADISGLSGTINRLEKLGISTNGDNNKLSLTDSAKLDAALANNMSEVEEFFTTANSGLAVKLSAYLERTAGSDGTLVEKEERYTDRIKGLDEQIAAAERRVQVQKDQWLAAFQAMETAQSKTNQQLQYLAQNFG